MMNFSNWVTSIQHRTEAALNQALPAVSIIPSRLHEAMRYASLGGGKRIRPLLCHAAGDLFTADLNTLDAAAIAVEFIHAYSLVHDDLPCMDDDVLRRGKPTCHIAFDEATAMLVGDALQSLAFQVISSSALNIDPMRQVIMLHTLATASGSRGMAGGQAIDIASTNQQLSLAELELMHIHKTGALIRASVILGAHCANAKPNELEQLSHFATRLGLLFQVVDDILDIESDTATLGKTAGKDATQNKSTYVTLLGLSQAKSLAQSLLLESHQALSSFGDNAQRLHELADFIAKRNF